MAYTVLARRYRSGTFDEVIGQDHVAQTLKRAISTGRVAHAYLFTGTRGVGKTSMARILAKALNCLASDAPTIAPCGQCSSCQAVARGDDIDVIEIDAASNTGVDNVRQIIENARFRPARARFKVYIIDEVHMLSKAAFNALLKIMEEPPEHVKFILATTEVDKILPTILSRCQRFDFRNIPTREIVAHLKSVVEGENATADEDALQLVARAGAGSMRDSLSVLERLLAVGEKHVTALHIEQLLGLPRTQLIHDLADAIGRGDVKQTLTRADAIVNNGLSVDTLLSSLTDHFHTLLILATCGSESGLVDVPGVSLESLVSQAAQFDPATLTQDVVILEELRRQMRSSQAGRALLDATLARLALAGQFESIDAALSRLEGGPPTESGNSAQRPVSPATQSNKPPTSPISAEKKSPELIRRQVAAQLADELLGQTHPSAVTNTTKVASAQVAQIRESASAVESQSSENGDRSVNLSMQESATLVGEKSDPSSQPPRELVINGKSYAPVAIDASDLGGSMLAIVERLRIAKPGLVPLLSDATLVGFDEGLLKFHFSTHVASEGRLLQDSRDRVSTELGIHLGRPTRIEVLIDEPAKTIEVSAAVPARIKSVAPSLDEFASADALPVSQGGTNLLNDTQGVENDPLVSAILREFEGRIVRVE